MHAISISDKKHDCQSSDGLCHDKCPFKNGTFPFWRLRNADEVPFLWTVKTLQMFDNPNSRYPLTKDPTRGYASTFFGPGTQLLFNYQTAMFNAWCKTKTLKKDHICTSKDPKGSMPKNEYR